MGPAQAIRTGFAKSFQFSGRATRSEFWWFTLITVTVYVGFLFFVDRGIFGFGLHRNYAPVADTMLLMSLPASMSVTARRLQDIDLPGIPGALVLAVSTALTFIPMEDATSELDSVTFGFLVADIILLLIAVVPSVSRSNRYGPPPSEVTP